jgi:hypothetical protein
MRHEGDTQVTRIEIKPHRWGWKVFEAPGVEPVFPKQKRIIHRLATAPIGRSHSSRLPRKPSSQAVSHHTRIISASKMPNDSA